MLVPSESKTKSQGLPTRTIAIVAAIVLHLIIGLVLSVQSLQKNQRNKPEIIAELLGPTEDDRPKIQKQSIKRQIEEVAAAAPTMTEVLRTDVAAVTAIPEMNNLMDTPLGLGQGNLGVGFGRSDNRMGSGAMFFGQQVRGRLGVVFDVSASMTEYIPIIVAEIQKNFRDASVICVNSSQMTFALGEGDVVPYKDATSSNVMMPYLADKVAQKMHRDLLSLPNCCFMEKRKTSLSYAIEYLMRDEIPVIFVFSDFHDQYHEEYIRQLTAAVQAENVTVHLQVLAPLRDFQKGREPLLQALAEAGGGKYVVGELLKRRR